MASSCPNTRKSARLVKQPPLITPVKTKTQKDEKIDTQTPLRRSERGKKDASFSIKARLSDQGSNLFEVNRKNPRERSLSEINSEGIKVGIRKSDQEFSGTKRKNMNSRSFRALFRAQKRKKIELDSERKDAPSDADCDVSKLSDSKVMEPRDKEGDDRLGEVDNDNEEECLKRFEGNRKRVQNFDGPSKKQEMESDLVKKHRKEIDNGVKLSPDQETVAGETIAHENQSLPVPAMGSALSTPSPASSINSHDNVYLPEENQDQSAERLISYDQKSVHIHLTAEMKKLCEILALEEDVKRVLHVFLGYVVENHRVSMENVAIFQALQISLCWIAASMLKQKIDRQDSLMLVKQKLNFECSDEAAEFIYKKLQMLKKTFLKQPNILKKLQALINPTSTEHVLKDIFNVKTLEPIHIRSESQEIAHEQKLADPAQAQWDRSCNHELRTKSMLCEKQQEETDEFHKRWEEKRLLLERKKLVEAAIIRQICSQNVAERTEKLNMLDIEFSRNLEEHTKLMEAGLEDLKAKQLAAKIEEREKESQWLAKYSGTENRISDAVPLCSFPATGLATLNEEERSPVLRDEEPNEVACPSYTPERHPKSDKESHEKQPSASNELYHHQVLKGNDSLKTVMSNSECHDETFSGKVNESHPADVPDDVQEEVRSIDDPDTNSTIMQSTRAEEGEDRVFGSEIPDLLVNKWDGANGTDPSPDQGSLVTNSHEERTPVLRDEEPNEVACPSYNPERHPKSGRETHEKQPSASNVLHHHHVRKGIDSQKTVTSNEESQDKTFPGETNDSYPADVPDDLLEEVRSIDDPDINATVMQSTTAEDSEDRLFGSDTPDLLVKQRDDANGTGPSPDQGSLVAHSHEERTPILRDAEPNEVACPSYSPERHPKSDRRTHEKQPSASNVLYHHHVQGTDSQKTVKSNRDSYDKTFPGDANESHPADMPDDVREEVRSIDGPDTNTTIMQSTRAEEGENRAFGSDAPDLLVNQRDDANGTDPSLDQGSLAAHSHEVIDSVDHAISTPLRQATMDELPQCAVSTEVQCEDQPNEDNLSQFGESVESENVVHLVRINDLATEADCASSEVAENGRTAEPNNPACFEKQPPSMDQLRLGPDSGGSACQSLNGGCTTFQANETIDQVEEPPNRSQHQPQVTENLVPSSSSDIRNPNIGNNWHNQPPVGNQGDQPTSALFARLHRVAVDDGLYQRINGAVLQAANQSGLSNSHTRLQADPLQIELEKLRKEIEQATKGHENLKSQLRSDCEKEIMEVVSQIRNKYKAKVQDAEALFQLKKKALDSNFNCAFSNKILADLVSTACIDVVPSGVLIQQGVMHQLQQIPLQHSPGPSNVCSLSAGSTPAAHQNMPLQRTRGPSNVGLPSAGSTPAAQPNIPLQHTQGPSSVGLPSAGSTPAAQQNIPSQPTQGPSNVGLSLTGSTPAAQQNIPSQPTRGPSNVGLSLTGTTPAAQQNIPLQPMQEPSNVGSSLPGEPRLAGLSASAPPIINSISYPQSNARIGANFRAAAPHLQSVGANVRAAVPHLQPVGAGIRAAAPHLQPFRPPISVPETSHSSLPGTVTTQQLSVNQRSLTLPSHQLPVQPRELLRRQPSPIQPSEPSPRIPYTSSQMCLPVCRTSSLHVSPTGSQGVGPAPSRFTHPSALELLRDFDRRFNSVAPNHSVSPVILESSVGPLSQSSLSTVVSPNVVYLSDDE